MSESRGQMIEDKVSGVSEWGSEDRRQRTEDREGKEVERLRS